MFNSRFDKLFEHTFGFMLIEYRLETNIVNNKRDEMSAARLRYVASV